MSKPLPARYRTTNWSCYAAALRKRGGSVRGRGGNFRRSGGVTGVAVTARLAPPAAWRLDDLRHVRNDVVCDVSYARRGSVAQIS